MSCLSPNPTPGIVPGRAPGLDPLAKGLAMPGRRGGGWGWWGFGWGLCPPRKPVRKRARGMRTRIEHGPLLPTHSLLPFLPHRPTHLTLQHPHAAAPDARKTMAVSTCLCGGGGLGPRPCQTCSALPPSFPSLVYLFISSPHARPPPQKISITFKNVFKSSKAKKANKDKAAVRTAQGSPRVRGCRGGAVVWNSRENGPRPSAVVGDALMHHHAPTHLTHPPYPAPPTHRRPKPSSPRPRRR